MANAVRIVIADDHTIFREGLKSLFDRESEFKVVGEARNGEEALELTKKTNPDILLLDMVMPKLSGLDVLRRLTDAGTAAKVILLSGAIDPDQIARAFELGARGLVMKDTATSMLFKSIRSVVAGQYWVGQKSAASLVQTMKQCRGAGGEQTRTFGLTPREMEVIRAVVSGSPTKEIAAKFNISEQTVKHHITNIFDKLGVYNRLELTLFVFHHGLVEK